MLSQTGLRTGARSATCLLCQWRSFSASYRRLVDEKPSTPPPPPPPPPPSAPVSSAPSPDPKAALGATAPVNAPGAAPVPEGPLAHAPRAYGKALKEFTPTPLARPIGMNYPPQAGENTGVDKRTLKERHADFTNYEKHLQRREYL
mgnify:FL=1